ncbi:MAG: TIGR00159 family protein [Ruminococcaceae bacterium]|jgi:diadenylate cyclase|nr:TIGR00159 family protein [Oscillospiraceae bacterium]
MEYVTIILENVLRYVGTIALTDWLDIALMAYFLYRALKLVGRSRAANLGKGVLIFLAALALSDVLQLNTINSILRNIVTTGVIALIVLFQPELRRLLEQVGSSKLGSFNPFTRAQQSSVIERTIAQTVAACAEMSSSRTGVLIVFERQIKLDDVARSGTIVDAQVSSELLRNIFFVKAALHDGAVVIRDGRLLAAGCILPLSHNTNISSDLGTRHRAGLGMSENSDAVVVIVSEETGAISVAIRGMLKRHLTAQTLEKLLTNELMPVAEENETTEKFHLRLPWQRKTGKETDGNAAE